MKKRILILATIALSAVSCTPDCTGDKSSYNSGYTHGEISSYGGYQSCSSYVDAMSNEGINLDDNSCFCAGFNDGKAGNENKYKKD